MRLSEIKGIDFHCHLDLFPDFQQRVQAVDEAGIATLAVTTTPAAFARNLEVARETSHVRAALGLHPQVIANRGNEVALFAQLLSQTRYVGEVGLDASPAHYGSWPQQIEIFSEILRLCASARGKILSIHSVRSARQVLDAIERIFPPDCGRVVLHWFTGSSRDLRRAVDLGCYFSVNPAMLRSPKGRELVRAIPESRLLTESDGPFQQVEGRPAAPLDMPALAVALAEIRHVESSLIHEQLRQNLARLLSE